MTLRTRTLARAAALALTLALALGACGPAPPPTDAVDLDAAATQALATLYAQMTATAPTLAPPTETPVPTPTVPRTPPALPGPYQSPYLSPGDTPHTYIQEPCEYLKQKWNPENSPPGTVVMVIMFHSISKGPAARSYQISAADQQRLMNDLKEQGFEAINTQQLADFLERNAKIPRRSVLLVVDDRHHADYFNDHFRPFYEEWGWPVVNAYIAKDERPDLWAENAALAAEGWVDYQAHGVIHNVPITSASSEEYMLSELQGAYDAIRENYGKAPIAYIWPGGGFTPRAAQLARQVGYRLGFTINPRGPLMFNWIPLADEQDPARPAYIPEGPVGDPLMVLPRYWDINAREHLDEVRLMGKEAAAYAEQNKAIELEYYDIVCAPTYGPIP